MSSARKTLLTGLATFVVGLALRLFGPDEHVVIFTPTKLGVVLMVVGGLESLYGVYKIRRDRLVE
ncbi:MULTISPECIES: DUF5708 family protein [unclassified Plantactinospora]|uniref:DUF5708 family protein n=1 Tax=unclassified Plantactinospora TaxID=2631981 RepID=UPI000D15481D|nr:MULTISPECIES: DUF5708 family protein [unclassified Plantactinospora]AVT31347.1 hypothetical protein C6361_19765 [Plantactinospora sp. BC1]AVT39880.1 hypothetical protein C6W10_29370 [Plantactinospora sp. BB1]